MLAARSRSHSTNLSFRKPSTVSPCSATSSAAIGLSVSRSVFAISSSDRGVADCDRALVMVDDALVRTVSTTELDTQSFESAYLAAVDDAEGK